MTNIVVLSKYPEIFYPFAQSARRLTAGTSKILVRDGAEPYASPKAWDLATRAVIEEGWHVGFGPNSPFNYSRNMNIGIQRALRGTGNVLLSNDDVRFTDPITLEVLNYALDKRPDIGIISPRIDGVIGNTAQAEVEKGKLIYTEVRLGFVCVLIRREVFDDIGLLDEQFGDGDYGWDDVDFCLRAKQAGWKLAVCGSTEVMHGDKHTESRGSTTYARNGVGYEETQSRQRFKAKWGHDRLW